MIRNRIGKFLFYAAAFYGALWTFWVMRELYAYWKLDAKTLCHVQEAAVQEISSSHFDILATYTFTWNEQPYRATSVLGNPYQLNQFSAEKAAEALKNISPTVYFNHRNPRISSLKREFPIKSMLQAGLTLGIALYLWVLNLYAANKKTQKTAIPLKRKYLIQNSLANWFMTGMDFFLSLLPQRVKPPIPSSPGSFLISNLAHMGDVLFMTSMLSALKQSFPNARIGVLIGSWSVPIAENHPYIDKIHVVDHWKLNRSPHSLFKKLIRYYKTKRGAIEEMKRLRYDVAIDAYYHFPNAIPIFWQSKIPVRIGYTSGGFGPLLTHAVDWTPLDQSVVDYYPALLDFFNIARSQYAAFLLPQLSRPPRQAGMRYLQQKQKGDFGNGYIVIHIGTGSPLKEWPIEKWGELVKKIQFSIGGYSLIFTGKGSHERAKIETIIHEVEGCINLADVLSWEEYLAILQDANLLIGVDSLAGHLAAAMDVPAVLIYSGMTNPHHWAPLGERCKILSHPVPCAPCYRSRGCSSMACVREIGVEEVHRTCIHAIKGI